jgi:hypothetical protein
VTYNSSSSIGGEIRDLTQTQVFDGLGERTKLYSQQDRYNVEEGTTTTETKTQFFVTSSVLNQVITELDENGAKTRTFVYQGNQILAWQQQSGSAESMAWEHRDVSNASVRLPGATDSSVAAELEPLGMDAGAFHLIAPHPPSYRPRLKEARDYPGFADSTSDQCRLDYLDTPCAIVLGMVASQAAKIDPRTNPSDAATLPGVIPLYGHYCAGVEGDPNMNCSDEIYDYTTLGSLANNLNPLGIVQQNPGPQSTIPQDLIDVAKTALQQKSCRDLFISGVDPIKLLDELASGNSSRGIIDMANLGPDVNAATNLMLGSRIVTGPDGKTFRQSTGYQPNTAHITLNTNIGVQAVTSGRFGLSDLQNKALTLIHELGHAANKIFGAGSSIIMEDNAQDKAILSQMNAYWVLNDCFKKSSISK